MSHSYPLFRELALDESRHWGLFYLTQTSHLFPENGSWPPWTRTVHACVSRRHPCLSTSGDEAAPSGLVWEFCLPMPMDVGPQCRALTLSAQSKYLGLGNLCCPCHIFLCSINVMEVTLVTSGFYDHWQEQAVYRDAPTHPPLCPRLFLTAKWLWRPLGCVRKHTDRKQA